MMKEIQRKHSVETGTEYVDDDTA